MLEHAGKKVFLGGNIGTPPSDYLVSGEKADVVVLEVSSFQLQNCRSLKPQVAVLLNFSPNHLDWHKDLEDVITSYSIHYTKLYDSTPTSTASSPRT